MNRTLKVDCTENSKVPRVASNSNYHTQRRLKYISFTLRLLNKSIQSAAMVLHCISILKSPLSKLQPLIATGDQLGYHLMKQLQWQFPADVIVGGLHLGMAFLNMAGDWLEGSGWTDLLYQTGVEWNGSFDLFA